MGMAYAIVGYPGVGRNETALRAAGFIAGDADPETAYTKDVPVFRPGPATGLETKAYDLPDGTVIKTPNGVAFCGPRYINHGPFIDTPSFRCPCCGARTKRDDGRAAAQMEQCFELFSTYFEGDDPSRCVTCLICEARIDVNDLIDDGPPTFVLSDVAVEFWEWPPDTVARAAQVLDAAMGQDHRMGWVKV